ncbi:hypothetical protein [Luteolibacter sp.]|uniref:hypothetical protein n=1 Tax=Luteolibacter sp. TaxID=1962973 RepID=UPI00326620D3
MIQKQPLQPPLVTFQEREQAASVRFRLSDGRQLALPYHHCEGVELDATGKQLTCRFGNLIIQIEGENLTDLLVGLQYQRLEIVQTGIFDNQKDAPKITGITLKKLQDEEPEERNTPGKSPSQRIREGFGMQ